MMKTNSGPTDSRPTRRGIATSHSSRNPKSPRPSLGLLGAAMPLGGGAAHGDLTIGSSVQWNDNNTRYISVYPGDSYVDAFIGGTGTPQQESAVFMSFGTVTDYTFYNGTNKGVGGYATLNQGSDRLGAVTTTATTSSALIATGVWTTADPSTDAANFTSNTHINAVVTVSGTIDVTGLSSGTIYFLYGTNGTRNTDFQVTETGGNTVQIAGNSFWVNTDTISAATAVGFTNDGSQNTITYSYAQTNAGKFMGVIISTFAGDAAPSWSSGYPKADTATVSGFTVKAKTNENGTAYYVVLPDGAAQPTAQQVKDGQDSTGTPVPAAQKGSISMTATAEGTSVVSGLSSDTPYDVFFVAEDGVPNLQAAPVLVDISTLVPDAIAPVWTAGYPKADTATTSGFTVRASINEAGTAYYVVLADGSTAPTTAEVVAGTGSGGAGAVASGSIALTASACNTVKGAGRDIESVGKAGDEAIN